MGSPIWIDAGRPEPTKAVQDTTSPCALCGHSLGRGVAVKDALGPGFTDRDRLAAPASSHVCVSCVWLLGGKPPLTFRTWSVVYREDRTAAPSNEKAAYPHGPHTHCASKADITEIIDVLLDPPESPWVCAIAESGHIHTLPWARVNIGDEWVVRYERENVAMTSTGFAAILHHTNALLAAGFVRDDITSEPHPSKLVKYGSSVWREHGGPLKQWRRSSALSLALSLSRKDTYEHIRDRAADRAGIPRRAPLIPRDEPRTGHDGQRNDREDSTNGVVATREDGPTGRVREGQDMGGAGHGDGAQAPNRSTAIRVLQGDLFDGPRHR